MEAERCRSGKPRASPGPRGDIDHVAENNQPGVSAGVEMSENSRPGVDSDPNLGLSAVFPLYLRAGGLQAGENGPRRAAGPQRRVFERRRGAEDNHDAVAGNALNSRAFDLNGALDDLRQALHEPEGGLFAKPFREGGEARRRRSGIWAWRRKRA